MVLSAIEYKADRALLQSTLNLQIVKLNRGLKPK